jgi:flotillin
MKNEYMEQVQAQQRRIEGDLKVQRKAKKLSPALHEEDAFQQQQQYMGGGGVVMANGGGGGSGGGFAGLEEPQSQACEVRITGYFRWKTVVVPPNAYVIHTRKGKKEPLHLGLGISFSFNPQTDSFLVVPSAMQTILISAYCICKDLQGLLVQGYVQWIIEDFGVAYKKLDFTDAVDPMRVVNVQLREQAEAAIKDKVSTMSIDDVLSDKQPIIQELTARLRHVAEGEGSNKGLGLSIVTVQIKEAVVSSARLWENLQKPFRSDRERHARLAELSAESAVKAQELEHSKVREKAQLETESELARLKAVKESERFDREQGEKIRRYQREQEVARQSLEEKTLSEKKEKEAQLELDRLHLEQELKLHHHREETRFQEKIKEFELQIQEFSTRLKLLETENHYKATQTAEEQKQEKIRYQNKLEIRELLTKSKISLAELRYQLENQQETKTLEFEALRQKIQNELSFEHLQAKLFEQLPEIAQHLPQPQELKSIMIGERSNAHTASSLTSLMSELLGIVESFRSGAFPKSNTQKEIL